METNLYKQAIVDAKAVRASAIANAKATLQESIAPKIQEMMRLKLSEDLEGDLEEDFELEEEFGDESNAPEVNEASLDEILDELNALEEENSLEDLEEAADLEEDYASLDEDDEEMSDDQSSDETVEMTAAALTSAISDFIEKVTNGELTIKDDAIVASGEGSDESDSDSDVDLGDSDDSGEEDLALEADTVDEEITLDEVLAELEKAELEEKKSNKPGKNKEEDPVQEAEKEKIEDLEEELEEAQDAIITLNETLKELNLLNAKLLFANKILREKNLSESEKSRVIKAFDRTKTVKETKNTYSTLMESFSVKKTAPAQQLKESIGFASKPSGNAQKQSTQIVESDAFVSRWQKIAGIK